MKRLDPRLVFMQDRVAQLMGADDPLKFILQIGIDRNAFYPALTQEEAFTALWMGSHW